MSIHTVGHKLVKVIVIASNTNDKILADLHIYSLVSNSIFFSYLIVSQSMVSLKAFVNKTVIQNFDYKNQHEKKSNAHDVAQC